MKTFVLCLALCAFLASCGGYVRAVGAVEAGAESKLHEEPQNDLDF